MTRTTREQDRVGPQSDRTEETDRRYSDAWIILPAVFLFLVMLIVVVIAASQQGSL